MQLQYLIITTKGNIPKKKYSTCTKLSCSALEFPGTDEKRDAFLYPFVPIDPCHNIISLSENYRKHYYFIENFPQNEPNI